MKRIQSIPAARTRRTLARSAVLLALALAAPASARTLAPGVLFEVAYAYDSLGRPASRTVNGELQTFEYDGRDRLVAVRAEDGSDLERYRYDAAGNILEKTVRGETTRFVYDAANQLVSRTDGTGTTAFAYDAAGRLVREGDKRFVYGNDGHVSRVLEGGAVVASFDYFLDGQVAAVHARGRTERFLWDGLAMVARGDRTFLNEPAATGGNPVASMGRSFLNDMLGSTVGVHNRKARTRTAVSMTLFGETDADKAYFTGKPALPELGYAFLVRSYRADLGRWQTRDPFGYPDGWNAMAYCCGMATICFDPNGCNTIADLIWDDFGQILFGWWLDGSGALLDMTGHEPYVTQLSTYSPLVEQILEQLIEDAEGRDGGSSTVALQFHAELPDNGYQTGFEMLHGTNATVGDFQISGTASISQRGALKIISYEVTMTWNDIIDPNSRYLSDSVLAWILKHTYSPADYTFRMSWTQSITIILE
jgi:RHS repeat-associated protein